jgi:hypothetical protein
MIATIKPFQRSLLIVSGKNRNKAIQFNSILNIGCKRNNYKANTQK